MKPVLEVKNLAKGFALNRSIGERLRRTSARRVQAVNGVSFSIGAGETLGLVGESGCGKSTVGRCILRLEKPDSGQIMLDGTDITALSPAQMRPLRADVQVVFQDPFASLNPRWTVGEAVAEPLRNFSGLSGAALREEVVRLFERVGLRSDQLDRYPHEFSGGQRQRIGIARALGPRPKLVVLDEPVSALDVSVQAQVINLLMDLQAEYGMAYLFIAHDLAVVRHISRRVAVMYLGQIVEEADRETLFAAPRHPYTAALLSAVPQVHAQAGRPDRVILKGDLPSPSNPPAGCRFHTRCPQVQDRCRIEEPALATSGDRKTACHFPL